MTTVLLFLSLQNGSMQFYLRYQKVNYFFHYNAYCWSIVRPNLQNDKQCCKVNAIVEFTQKERAKLWLLCGCTFCYLLITKPCVATDQTISYGVPMLRRSPEQTICICICIIEYWSQYWPLIPYTLICVFPFPIPSWNVTLGNSCANISIFLFRLSNLNPCTKFVFLILS